MLEKTFDPAAVEPRLYASWEASGAFAPTDDPAARAVLHRHPAAERHRLAAHRPRAEQHPAGRADPLRSACAARRRCGCRAPTTPASPPRWWSSASWPPRATSAAATWAARPSSRGSGSGRRSPAARSCSQLRRLGASCDWSRERFTLDEGLSAAVRKVFVTLHRQKLIYRDKRLVNWDPELPDRDLRPRGRAARGRRPLSGISPIRSRTAPARSSSPPPGRRPCWATPPSPCIPTTSATRIWSASACACRIVGRPIPIIADDYADPEKGSGAVKITPAHDFNDFKVGQRHHLPMINILDARRAAERERAAGLPRPGPLRGAQEGRRRVRGARPAARASSRPATLVPHGDARGVVDRALSDRPVVGRRQDPGRSRPSRRWRRAAPSSSRRHWEKTYFEWMRNIEPWCVSRQLWWGHRIPAWYGPDGPHLRRGDRGGGQRRGARALWPRRAAAPGRGRARHLVLLGAVAVLDPGLAGRDAPT